MWHRVKVKRYHRDVQLTVDRELVVIGRFCADIEKTKIFSTNNLLPQKN